MKKYTPVLSEFGLIKLNTPTLIVLLKKGEKPVMYTTKENNYINYGGNYDAIR